MERLTSINWLAVQAEHDLDIEKLEQYEMTSQVLNKTTGLLPTIGCEIEVKASTIYPELFQKYRGAVDSLGRFVVSYGDMDADDRAAFDDEFNELEKVNRPRYEATVAAGIPVDRSDAYWEFANLPSYSWKTLATEVALLMQDGFIPTGHEHALHVSLGVHNNSGGMCLVLAGLELLFVNPNRIVLATEGNKYGGGTAWARRGKDGLRDRFGSGVQLNQQHATELRTLSLSTPAEAHDMFFTSQMLTAGLNAFRLRNKSDVDKKIVELAELWPVYRQAMKDLWCANELPASSWGQPQRKPDYWLKWAEIIEQKDDQTQQVFEVTRAYASTVHLGLWELSNEIQAMAV